MIVVMMLLLLGLVVAVVVVVLLLLLVVDRRLEGTSIVCENFGNAPQLSAAEYVCFRTLNPTKPKPLSPKP